MLLDIALWRRDTYMQRMLLEKWADILPIRDRVEAFRQTGDPGAAFDYAFKGLEKNRRDVQLYQQFRSLADTYADKFRSSSRYINWDGYREFLEDTFLKYDLGGGFLLTPSFKIGKEISHDSGSLINVPSYHYNAGLSLGKKFGGCGITVKAGILDSMEATPYFQVASSCSITDMASISFLYGERIEDDDNLFMYLGGMKREIQAGFFQNINKRMSLSGTVSQNWYFSQDDKNIGSGNDVFAELDYKLGAAFPDYTLRGFVQSSHFYEGNNKGDIAQLSPFPDFNQLPSSYSLIGAGIRSGNGFKGTLEKSWRPFFSGDLFMETDSGMGYDAQVGYGGPLTANDNMNFGATYYSNFHGAESSFLEYFIDYNYYF